MREQELHLDRARLRRRRGAASAWTTRCCRTSPSSTPRSPIRAPADPASATSRRWPAATARRRSSRALASSTRSTSSAGSCCSPPDAGPGLRLRLQPAVHLLDRGHHPEGRRRAADGLPAAAAVRPAGHRRGRLAAGRRGSRDRLQRVARHHRRDREARPAVPAARRVGRAGSCWRRRGSTTPRASHIANRRRARTRTGAQGYGFHVSPPAADHREWRCRRRRGSYRVRGSRPARGGIFGARGSREPLHVLPARRDADAAWIAWTAQPNPSRPSGHSARSRTRWPSAPAAALETARDPEVPVAATVVIVRDAASRARGAHDRAPRPRLVRGRVGVSRRQARGRRPRGAARTSSTAARRAGVRETCEEIGCVVDADAPRAAVVLGSAARARAAHPHVVLRRADDPGGELILAPDEVDRRRVGASRATMLARHGRGEVTLYPPTWVTLHELAEQPRRRRGRRVAPGSAGSALRDRRSPRRPTGRCCSGRATRRTTAETGQGACGIGIASSSARCPWVYTRTQLRSSATQARRAAAAGARRRPASR